MQKNTKYSRSPNQYKNPDLKKQNMVREIIQDLRTNPRYKDFFAQFNTAYTDYFIENYALRKASYIKYGKQLNSFNEADHLRFYAEAEERLWDIQRKKLFNLECEWRAELITLPSVELTCDFEYWKMNIVNCPFLSPISDEEFELYNEYLLSDDFCDFKMEWQHMSYKEIKDANLEGFFIPPWFEYYNMKNGTGTLLLLPDKRGEKEEYYINIWQRINSVKPHTDLTASLKCEMPTYFDLSIIEEFIRKYEDAKMLEYYKSYENELDKTDDKVLHAVRILQTAGEFVPIESSFDWRTAVISAARKHEQKRISKAIKFIFNKYKHRLEVGIAHEPLANEKDIKQIEKWCKIRKSRIIQARVANNEPADLNF